MYWTRAAFMSGLVENSLYIVYVICVDFYRAKCSPMNSLSWSLTPIQKWPGNVEWLCQIPCLRDCSILQYWQKTAFLLNHLVNSIIIINCCKYNYLTSFGFRRHLRQWETGFAVLRVTKYQPRIEKCLVNKNVQPTTRALTLKQVSIAFFILGIGISLSCAAYIIEWIIYKGHRAITETLSD